jgi:hypothetical protein
MHERLARQLALEGQWPVWIDSPRITDDEPVNEYYFVRRHAWTRRLFLK